MYNVACCIQNNQFDNEKILFTVENRQAGKGKEVEGQSANLCIFLRCDEREAGTAAKNYNNKSSIALYKGYALVR
ncbi:tRNA-2-methylthio-N(6)-dimethylallyladenosine synthase [Dirofilaria immitis]